MALLVAPNAIVSTNYKVKLILYFHKYSIGALVTWNVFLKKINLWEKIYIKNHTIRYIKAAFNYEYKKILFKYNVIDM